MSLVHVNRTLKELRGQDVARIERGRVHIMDLARLRSIAMPLLDVYEREQPAFGAAVH